MKRTLCLCPAELLVEINKAFVGGDPEALFGVKKTVIFVERFVERFFLSVNSCMVDSYLRFEKKW